MGGLLDNARKFFQGLTPAHAVQAQGYSVACPEGHRLTGIRTDGYQSLRCPTCGGAIFVLPRSFLPEPVPPSTSTHARPSPRSTTAATAAYNDDDAPVSLTDPFPQQHTETWQEPEGDADGVIEWVDEVPQEPSPVPKPTVEPKASAARKSVPDATRRPRPRKPAAAVAHDEPIEPPRVRVSMGEVLRTHRVPLLLLGVILVVVATVAIRSWRLRRQDLPRIAELGRVEGLPALDDGKFDRAYQLLSEAKRAVIELGDEFQGASAIKQGADEAAIINQLLPESLEELLDEATRADPKDWPKRFNTMYQGRSVILDTFVTAVPDRLGEGRYALEYQILPLGGDGGPPRSVGRIDTTGFQLLDTIKPKVGDRITIGVRLASFRFDPDTEQWLARLEPDSGVIMTHMKALEALGWPSSADSAMEEQP